MKFLSSRDVKLGKRDPSSHKGQNGRVLAVVGSSQYVGAAYFAAMAAYRSGVDQVVVAAPEKVAWALNCMSPDLITAKFKGNFLAAAAINKIVTMSKDFDVTLIGNGIGKRKATLKFAAAVIKKIKGLKVIDADAIKAVRIQDVTNAILTPHKGEFKVLLSNSKISEQGLRQKKIIGNNTVLLKGRIDKIISAEKVAYNKTGNAGMTKGGTGDVLAGLCAGLLAQEKDLFKAACAAAYANGKAGNLLLKKYGWGFTASDLIEKLPTILKRLWKIK